MKTAVNATVVVLDWHISSNAKADRKNIESNSLSSRLGKKKMLKNKNKIPLLFGLPSVPSSRFVSGSPRELSPNVLTWMSLP
jgi:hypothetical protein